MKQLLFVLCNMYSCRLESKSKGANALDLLWKKYWIKQWQQKISILYYICAIEIGLLWAKIIYLKSHAMALDFWLETDMFYIFQMMYQTLNLLRGCKISEVKLGRKIYLPVQPGLGESVSNRAELTSDIFAAPWPKSMLSTSFERSKAHQRFFFADIHQDWQNRWDRCPFRFSF